jgi:hypothetical protein
MIEFLHICCDRIVERYEKSNLVLGLLRYCTLGEIHCCKDEQTSTSY